MARSQKSDIVVVNAADLHLDATHVGGWSQEHGVHRNWVESFRQLDALIALCNDIEPTVLNLAGDIFDTGRPMAEAVARTLDAFAKLNPRTKVVIQPGNHDQQTVVGEHRNPLEAYLAEQPWCYAVQSKAGIVDVDGFKIVGAPWLKVAGSSQQEIANHSLEDTVRRLMDEVGDGPSMFAGHVVLNECSFDSGKRGSEVTMTTTTLEAHVAADVLEEGPWGAARLGHIHKRQQLTPKVGYTGSTYKVSFGETNEEKGVDIVRFDSRGHADVEFHRFAVRELIKADVSRDGGESPALVVERATRGDVVRFVVDYDEEPKGFDRDIRALTKKGVEVQIHRKPRPRDEVVTRSSGLQTDTDPMVAFRAYMEKQGLSAERQQELLAEFQDLTA